MSSLVGEDFALISILKKSAKRASNLYMVYIKRLFGEAFSIKFSFKFENYHNTLDL